MTVRIGAVTVYEDQIKAPTHILVVREQGEDLLAHFTVRSSRLDGHTVRYRFERDDREGNGG
jgi:hypothetical protein